MDFIKTGIGISKTIRNAGRLKEIISVFARHGFDEFISRGMTSKIPDFVLPRSKKKISEELKDVNPKDWNHVIGRRLRLCFEELGPVFIKFGQLLSSREDIFPAKLIDELKFLRDKVKPINFEVVKKEVERALNSKVENVFKQITTEPIGTASIGVVYKAKLVTGESVVIKVKRPGIEKIILTDFSILKFLAIQLEKISDEIKYMGLSRIVEDFSYGLQNELDFNIEARNCINLASNLKAHDTEEIFYLPEIYGDFSNRDILVMEFLDGIPFSDADKINQHIEDVAAKLELGIGLFIKTFLYDGFFHADLHGGNFFYLPNGKIGLIDFGLMGTLGKKGRESFMSIIYSIVNMNFENLVFEFLDVADYSSIPDIDEMISDVKYSLSPFIGLTVQQTNFSILLNEILGAMAKHQVFLPREWFMVFRALATLDGVGKSIGQDIDLHTIFERDINKIIKENIKNNAWKEDAIWASRDLISLTRIIPRHLKWFLRDFAKKKYAFEIKHVGLDENFSLIYKAIVFLSFSILSGIFFYSGVNLLTKVEVINKWDKIPILTYVFWLGSLTFLFKGMRVIK